MRPIPVLARAALGAAILSAALPALATRVLVNPGDIGERTRAETYGVLLKAVEPALRRERLAEPAYSMSTDTTADLAATRSRIPDVFVAPAHVIGSAVRYGYLPLASITPPVQAVLVAHRDHPVRDFASARGLPLGLPTQDSVVTYLVRGEANAANTTVKRHFGPIFETRYQEALLICLQIKRCDVVGVEKALFDRWMAAGEPLKVVAESKAVPGIAVAVKPGTPAAAAAPGLRGALMALGANGAAARGLVAAAVEGPAFDYVATLGYFTPRALPGAQVVDAAGVRQLMQQGAVYVDTRTEAEFKAGRVPGSRFVPYVEKSAKDADYDARQDKFDIAALPADRDKPIIFACNGAECWKSYKASRAAQQAGFTQVHWFRGGLPEWRGAGLPIESEK